MTDSEFERLLAATNILPEGRTASACYLVLVDGESPAEAARAFGISRSAVSRALRKFPTAVCPTCGAPLEVQT